MDDLVNKQPFAQPMSLLTDLVLIVHKVETEEDVAAKNLLDELTHEVGANVRYRVERLDFDTPEYPLPYLRYSRSTAYGLKAIMEVAETERRFR